MVQAKGQTLSNVRSNVFLEIARSRMHAKRFGKPENPATRVNFPRECARPPSFFFLVKQLEETGKERYSGKRNPAGFYQEEKEQAKYDGSAQVGEADSGHGYPSRLFRTEPPQIPGVQQTRRKEGRDQPGPAQDGDNRQRQA